jgi:hypothetical protein
MNDKTTAAIGKNRRTRDEEIKLMGASLLTKSLWRLDKQESFPTTVAIVFCMTLKSQFALHDVQKSTRLSNPRQCESNTT